MSWSMWHIDGIGFALSEVHPDKYKAFLKKHMRSLENAKCRYAKELLDHLNDGPLEEGVEACQVELDVIQEMTDNYTLSEPVAVIMTQETGIRFSAPGLTDEGEDYVLFTAANPWEYNAKEKELTFEGLKAIMKKYSEELCVKLEDDVDLVYAG